MIRMNKKILMYLVGLFVMGIAIGAVSYFVFFNDTEPANEENTASRSTEETPQEDEDQQRAQDEQDDNDPSSLPIIDERESDRETDDSDVQQDGRVVVVYDSLSVEPQGQYSVFFVDEQGRNYVVLNQNAESELVQNVQNLTTNATYRFTFEADSVEVSEPIEQDNGFIIRPDFKITNVVSYEFEQI